MLLSSSVVPVQIRPVELDDRAAVLGLLADLGQLYPDADRWLERWFASHGQSSCGWLAEAAGRAVGCLLLVDKGSRLKLANLYVVERWRRHKVGSALIACAAAYWQAGSWREVYTTAPAGCCADVFAALAPYGFAPVATVPDRYGPGRDEAIASLTLDRHASEGLGEQHRAVYDELADEYEARVPALRDVTSEGIGRFLSFTAPGALRMLDVGCGAGLTTRMLTDAGHHVTAVDISAAMVAHTAARTPQATAVVGDYAELELEPFDAIVAFAFIHLFPAAQAHRILAKMHDDLVPGGLLYIGSTDSPASREGLEGKADYDGAPRRFRKRWMQLEFEAALMHAGFAAVDFTAHDDPFGKRWMDYVVRRP